MIVCITGISKGIGKAMLDQLLENKNVDRVYAVSSSVKISDTPLHAKLKLINADFSLDDYTDKVNAGIDEAEINVLINNAGYLQNELFKDATSQNYDTTFNINVKAPYFLMQALLPKLMKGKAHVVNIGSIGGFQGSAKFPGLSIYSASKAALAALTECLAEELKNDGVKVNCLALGAVNTEMLQNAFPGFKPNIEADEMAKLILNFTFDWGNLVSGQVFPITSGNPG